MIFVQQLAQMMILLISIIMQQYCVLVILARLSTDQGITILLFSCLYMLPFVFGHQMLQSGIELIYHEIFREILKKKIIRTISLSGTQFWNHCCMNERRVFSKLTGLKTSGFLSSQLILLLGKTWMGLRSKFKGSFSISRYADLNCVNE